MCTLAEQIGTELVTQRNQQAKRGRSKVAVRVAATPTVVAVEVDGGRLRTRAADAGPGVHDAQNKEDKIACLVTLKSQVCAQDPQPEPPPCFQLPRRVAHVVQQMAGQAGDASAKDATAAEPLEKQAEQTTASGDPEQQPWAPRKQVRTCVASMANSEAFGRMVAVEAKLRDFYRAKQRAFVADGLAYNWKLQQRHFPTFVPIVDFLHVLCYVYRAAWAVGADEAKRWQQYLEWLRACWQGRVAEVIEQLRQWQEKIGAPPEGEELATTDPRRVVAETLSYFGHNEERMKYPEYRRAGLPITSSLVEWHFLKEEAFWWWGHRRGTAWLRG